ncbi:MAG: hypothetical protein NW201_00210 [Gemmatimonadales bacterium]|nr:hypothetical protein [Gemmatimonadales bacterium]
MAQEEMSEEAMAVEELLASLAADRERARPSMSGAERLQLALARQAMVTMGAQVRHAFQSVQRARAAVNDVTAVLALLAQVRDAMRDDAVETVELERLHDSLTASAERMEDSAARALERLGVLMHEARKVLRQVDAAGLGPVALAAPAH